MRLWIVYYSGTSFRLLHWGQTRKCLETRRRQAPVCAVPGAIQLGLSASVESLPVGERMPPCPGIRLDGPPLPVQLVQGRARSLESPGKCRPSPQHTWLPSAPIPSPPTPKSALPVASPQRGEGTLPATAEPLRVLGRIRFGALGYNEIGMTGFLYINIRTCLAVIVGVLPKPLHIPYP